jgi:hypothetical protein
VKVTISGGPHAGFKWGPVEFGGHYTETQIQTLNLKLAPVPKLLELMSTTSDALTDAITSISSVVHEALRSEPRFGLDEATVSLNVGIDEGGKITVIAGGGINSKNAHTLTLTLKNRP